MELRFNRETEIQMKMAKMTPEEKEAYLKGPGDNVQNGREPLFGEGALNGENQTITEEGVNLYTPATTVSTKTSSETENIMLPDFKNEQQTLLFTFYGKNWSIVDTFFDITQFEFKKDSKGNITDIYPKNLDKSADISHSKADRYSLRYDSQGNLIKSFKQDIDENGNIRGQEIKNYNADGTVKNTSYYRYTYDENGNQTGQTRSVVSEKYGDDGNILQEIFGEELENVGLMTFNHIPAIGESHHSITYDNRGDVTYNQDGTVSEITYKGNKYLLRYDDEGNLTKAIKQSCNDEGKIISQEINEYRNNEKQNKITYTYKYDEDGNRLSDEVTNEKYGEPFKMASSVFGIDTSKWEIMDTFPTNMKKSSDGKLQEFTFANGRYIFRYDENGELIKGIRQVVYDGKIVSQEIITFDTDGAKIKEVRTYDEQGVDNTSDSQKAINNVRKLYTTKSGNVRESENASNKLKAFIENDTLAKLNAAGVSKEDIEALLKELFGDDLDEFLYSKSFMTNSNLKGLYSMFEQQKQKIGLEYIVFYEMEINPDPLKD